jgi:PAS domain S-box-containing protein
VLFSLGIAVLVALLGLFLRKMLSPWLGADNPYHVAWLTVVLCAWYCGVGPSAIATFINLIGIWRWFLPPFGSLAPQEEKIQIFGLIGFLLFSSCIIALGEANRRAKIKCEQEIAERLRVEKVLRESEHRFQSLFASNVIPMICANMQRITEANDVFLKMINYNRDDLASGQLVWPKVTPPEHLAEHMRALEELTAQGIFTAFETDFIRKDGDRVPILIGGTILNSAPLEWLCFVLDLSNLKQVEAELRKSHEELELRVAERTQALAASLATLESEVELRRTTEQVLRELSARSLRLQDEERRRIARDLHDSTGQTLVALKMMLGSLAKAATLNSKVPNLITELESLAEQALQEIRVTSHLLHPPLLDEVGFSPAAQWYVEGFTKRSGIKANLELSAAPPMTKDEELVFFRILQEGLTNVLRHSGSPTVDIRLSADSEDAILSIRDFGKGIPSDQLQKFRKAGAGGGVGLGGMKQRVRIMGGHLRVECDGIGTCVTATLPLSKPAVSTDESTGLAGVSDHCSKTVSPLS